MVFHAAHINLPTLFLDFPKFQCYLGIGGKLPVFNPTLFIINLNDLSICLF